MSPEDVLILPGWQNSSPDHWQSRWEARYGYRRVEQHDWMHPCLLYTSPSPRD